jgi:DNA-directed RNA polymerase subunit RPC12/RpoP
MAVTESTSSGLRLVCPECRYEIPLGPAAVLIGSPTLECPKCSNTVLGGSTESRQPRS